MGKAKSIAKSKAAAEAKAKEETDAKSAEKAAPEPVARPEPDPDAKARAYVESLLSGETQPANRYVGDLVTQLRDAQTELDVLRGRMQQTREALERMAQRSTALHGISQQLGMNLVRWRDAEKE